MITESVMALVVQNAAVCSLILIVDRPGGKCVDRPFCFHTRMYVGANRFSPLAVSHEAPLYGRRPAWVTEIEKQSHFVFVMGGSLHVMVLWK